MPPRSPRQYRLGAPLPPAILDVARRARKIVEVGVGAEFGTALAVKAENPLAEMIVTDVSPVVRAAPAELAAFVDDVARPTWAIYEGADLIMAVRAPEEIQIPIARVARRVGASLALRALKDEWADVGEAFRAFEPVSGGWRLFR